MKILCIVQARMGSERLPGKVLKEINGYPMIFYTLKRLCKSRYIDDIIVATSIKDMDTPLAEYCKSLGVDVFRGSEGNVLERYKEASDKYGGDIIIRVTGDCPLIDPVVVDNVITKYLMNNYDYVRLDVPDRFIRGFDVEIFSKKSLDKVYSIVNDKNNDEFSKYKEHVTYYIYTHQQEFNVAYVKGEKFYCKDYRLCVDTDKDFQLVENIYEHFRDIFISAKDVVHYLDNNYEIANINNEVKQRI